jgi:hypothetical protein
MMRSPDRAGHIGTGTTMRDGSSRKAIVTTVARPDLIDLAAEWIWSSFWKRNGYAFGDIRELVVASDAVVGPSQCMVLLWMASR